MPKKMLTVLAALSLVLAVAGGGLAADQTVLSIATGGTGGTYYAIGGGISKLVAQYLPKYKLVVQSTGASIENIHLVANKKVNFAIVMPDATYFGYTGGREFKGKAKYPNLRAVMAGHASLLQGAALKSSGVKSFAGLKGKKVALSAPGSPSKFVSMAALAAYGLKPSDYNATYLTYAEMIQAVKDGTIDASMVFAGIPTSSMLDLSATVKINLLPVEVSNYAYVKKHYPYYAKAVIPANTYSGQDKPLPTISAPAVLITNSDVPAQAVYDLLKTIVEHTAELGKIHKAGNAWNLQDAVEGIAIPFHPGAEKYLKEKGKLK
ncbi:MAG: TAXI family TRAP transporter solute-binding subunit [Desulfarculus sp.]|jgi:TRAP transporter TAXI family solute receptor|nr:MAG: TAXI family TRAP transporter solute-binding subunit [Desulfarculus sp.]